MSAPLDKLSARCSGCRRPSEPRRLGETPEGWRREDRGQGRYYCPECSKDWRYQPFDLDFFVAAMH